MIFPTPPGQSLHLLPPSSGVFHISTARLIQSKTLLSNPLFRESQQPKGAGIELSQASTRPWAGNRCAGAPTSEQRFPVLVSSQKRRNGGPRTELVLSTGTDRQSCRRAGAVPEQPQGAPGMGAQSPEPARGAAQGPGPAGPAQAMAELAQPGHSRQPRSPPQQGRISFSKRSIWPQARWGCPGQGQTTFGCSGRCPGARGWIGTSGTRSSHKGLWGGETPRERVCTWSPRDSGSFLGTERDRTAVRAPGQPFPAVLPPGGAGHCPWLIAAPGGRDSSGVLAAVTLPATCPGLRKGSPEHAPPTCRPVPALVPVLFACEGVPAVLPPLLAVLLAQGHVENPLPTPAAVNLQDTGPVTLGRAPESQGQDLSHPRAPQPLPWGSTADPRGISASAETCLATRNSSISQRPQKFLQSFCPVGELEAF